MPINYYKHGCTLKSIMARYARFSVWAKVLLIFALGWFSGSIIVMLLFQHTTLQTASSAMHPVSALSALIDRPYDQNTREIASRSFSSAIEAAWEAPRNVLPNWDPLPRNISLPFPIYLSWRLDSRYFTAFSYKALESILVNYPSARIRVHRSKTVHMCDMPLSPNQFTKYGKMGFDIAFILDDLAPYRLRSEYGGEFWTRWVTFGCITLNCSKPIPADLLHQLQSKNMRQPYFAELYQHLIRIWKSGGIYSDFTYLFLGHFDDPHDIYKEGSRIQPICWSYETSSERLRADMNMSLHSPCTSPPASAIFPSTPAYQRVKDSEGLKSWTRSQLVNGGSSVRNKKAAFEAERCEISTLLFFRQVSTRLYLMCWVSYHILNVFDFSVYQPYSNTLDCVLRHYAQPAFLQCLNADLWIDILDVPSSESGHTYRWGRSQGAECLKQAFSDCYEELQVENFLNSEASHNVLEDFSDNRRSLQYLVHDSAEFSRSKVDTNRDWFLFPSTKLIWLGADVRVGFGSYRGNLIMPSQNSHFRGANPEVGSTFREPLPEIPQTEETKTVIATSGSILGKALLNINPNTVWLPSHAGHRVNSSCSIYSRVDRRRNRVGPLSSHQNWRYGEASCAPSIIIPGFLRSASRFIADALVVHPNIVPQLYTTNLVDIESLRNIEWYKGKTAT